MKIKIVLDSCFKGMSSGWPTRYIGLITELYRNHQLYIYAPGDTSLFSNYFPNAFVCSSTSGNHKIKNLTCVNYLRSLVKPNGEEIFLPEFYYYPDFKNLLMKSSGEHDLLFYFGLGSYISYHDHSCNVPEICDICDSALRHREARKQVLVGIQNKIINHLDMLYLRRIKRKVIPNTLLITTITDVDTMTVKNVLKKNRVITIPNGVSVDCQVDENNINEKSSSNIILFCGSLDYGPNIHAIFFIVNKLWKRIKEKYPEMEFQIVGRNPGTELKSQLNAYNGVRIYQDVPDIFEYYKKARMLLSPIFLGGGMKNKLLEALATGTPIVTNREGKIGITVKEGKHGFFGESADELVKAVDLVMNLEKEEYRQMVYSCRDLGKQYSWRCIGDSLESIIESAVQG